MGERLERGLRLMEQVGYHLLPAAAAHVRALELVSHGAERRYLERRLREVRAG